MNDVLQGLVPVTGGRLTIDNLEQLFEVIPDAIRGRLTGRSAQRLVIDFVDFDDLHSRVAEALSEVPA